MEIIKKFENTIESYNMIDKGVIACVSGGADSVCMLYLLLDYCTKNGSKIICAHFNHGIRGDESDGDEEFVRNICSNLKIEFISGYKNVPALAKEVNRGIEETARIARYDFFRELAIKYGYTIAVAHNRNDRIETIIHNILRGTSPEGLKGISYVRDNIVRPMLDIERKEIEEYLSFNKIEYRNDSTNTDTAYTRNRIRHSVIPFLEEQYGNFTGSLIRLSDLAVKDSEYLNMVADECFRETVRNNAIDVLKYSNQHYAIRSRVLKKTLCGIRNEAGELIYKAGINIEMSIINRLDDFIINGISGKYVEASKGVIAKKEYDKVYIISNNEKEEKKERIEKSIVSISGFDDKLLNDRNCACFDLEKLNEFTEESSIQVRSRKEGDLFTPFGCNGTKKLKKFFIDEKIPESQRNSMLLLASGSNILWVPGVRRSSIAPIDNSTKNVIIFRLYQNNMEDKQ